MNERFIRCAQCGFPHLATAKVCPVTRQPIHGGTGPVAAVPRTKPNAWAMPTRLSPVSAAASATQPPGKSPDEAFIGQVIGGKYQIRGVLGHGGMGTVFEAVHVGIGRQSAIKVLHTSQLRKKDAVRRFHQEAKAAARIGHPNICEVYDLGTLEDGRPYLVMEKLVGETLADVIAREGGLAIHEVVDILRQVLSGLYAAHENGIIHRDIKPENVFLSKRVGCPPVAKLLDFGVSKMMSHHPQSKDDGELEMTRTGIVLGTPYYLAPEQARGDRNLDARVDLYACGILLYEALTGRRPFVAANYNALLVQILTGAPRPMRELRKDVPEDLERVVDKAMSRERHQRYQSAVDFQLDLAQLEIERPPPASRAPPPPARPSQPPAPSAEPRSASVASGRASNAIPLVRQKASEAPLRATRVGPIAPPLPYVPLATPTPPSSPAPSAVTVARPPDPIGTGTPDGRRALLNALPIAPPFLPAPSAVAPGPPEAMSDPQATEPHPIQPPLSSSEEIDALMAIETPTSVPRAKGRPSRARIQNGFEDQPTEVQTAREEFLDDVSTAQVSDAEAARLMGGARKTPHPPAPSAMAAQRKPTILARRSGDFSDDSKTDVMSSDLRNRMREAQKASMPEPPRSKKR